MIDGRQAHRIAGDSVAGDTGHDAMLNNIASTLNGVAPDVIGHRVVHGGPTLFDPIVINEAVLAQLHAASVFAPLHGPLGLTLISAARRLYPNVPQVACFDTGFHQHIPPIAATLPMPKAFHAQGLRRYGFHGLSCQSIVRQLGENLPERLVIAHLGSGASVTAVLAGQSVDTSMGLTPSGGVVMATRCGDVDPGLLLYLLRERRIGTGTLEDIVDRKSGLLGLSDYSGDLKTLRAAIDTVPDAALAIAMFCRSVAKQIAAMVVSLGGIDLLVFSGGIGEHDAATRDAICADLSWAGISTAVDTAARARVTIVPANEEEQIACNVSSLFLTTSG